MHARVLYGNAQEQSVVLTHALRITRDVNHVSEEMAQTLDCCQDLCRRYQA
jgi:hypothetical protein